MSKTNTVASKFSDNELDKIDWFVQKMGTTRSALVHDLVIQGVSGAPVKQEMPKGVKDVIFVFKEDYAFFWKNREYRGIINGDDASIYFGGEWKTYKLADLPVNYHLEA